MQAFSFEFPLEMVAARSRELGFPLMDAVGYRYTLVFILAAAITVAVVSTIRGVQGLSIGFIWWGKHAQLQVSVKSFSSSSDGVGIGSSSKILIAKLGNQSNQQFQKGEDRPQMQPMSFSFQNKDWKIAEDVKASACSKIVHKIEEEDLSKEQLPVSANGDDAEFCNDPMDMGSEESDKRWSFPVPDRASSLLHPFFTPSSSGTFSDQSSGTSDFDAMLNMRINMKLGEVASSPKGSYLMQQRARAHSLVAKGPQHIARARDKVVRIWDTSNAHFLQQFHVAEGEISAFDVGWEDKKLVLGTSNGSVSVWDLPTGKCVSTSNFQDNFVEALSFNIDGCMISGSLALDQSAAFLSLFDSRILTRACGLVSSSLPDLYGLQLHGRKCYVRNSIASLSEYDLRMIGAVPLESFII